jgi:DNA replication and repair protein RecF
MSPGVLPVRAEAPARLAVGRLTLSQFRCYEAARIETDPRPVVLTGPNGAGKTNLLEALSFLAPGRGLRRARLGDVDRRAPSGATLGLWAVAAELDGLTGRLSVGTGREDAAERRTVKIDGRKARGAAALAGHVAMVWLTPQMDRLFLEGPGARRRFLDRLVYGFDPDHAGRVAAYDHALRERTRLLREGPADAAWLAALEDTMARHGIAIAAARADAVARIDEALAGASGPFPRARLGLQGALESWLGQGPALAAEDRLRAGLAASRRQDSETGGAALGPHRSDLAVRHAGNGMAAELCSTGEQKALLIAILLAHARLQAAQRGAAPIMLLDEVAAHLDELRRRALFAEILGLGAQAWLTGTDPALFAGLGEAAQFFAVRDARIAPERHI